MGSAVSTCKELQLEQIYDKYSWPTLIRMQVEMLSGRGAHLLETSKADSTEEAAAQESIN